jgi:hypothetical protein
MSARRLSLGGRCTMPRCADSSSDAVSVDVVRIELFTTWCFASQTQNCDCSRRQGDRFLLRLKSFASLASKQSCQENRERPCGTSCVVAELWSELDSSARGVRALVREPLAIVASFLHPVMLCPLITGCHIEFVHVSARLPAAIGPAATSSREVASLGQLQLSTVHIAQRSPIKAQPLNQKGANSEPASQTSAQRRLRISRASVNHDVSRHVDEHKVEEQTKQSTRLPDKVPFLVPAFLRQYCPNLLFR